MGNPAISRIVRGEVPTPINNERSPLPEQHPPSKDRGNDQAAQQQVDDEFHFLARFTASDRAEAEIFDLEVFVEPML